MEVQLYEKVHAHVVVGKMQRTTIISQHEDYLHVEYRTKMGFVDDVEFYLERLY